MTPDRDAIACPFCDPDVGHPAGYGLTELFAHILDRHPSQLLDAGREILREQALERTEIVYVAKKEAE